MNEETLIDKVFDWTNKKFLAGKFSDVDNFLLNCKVDKLPHSAMIGVLTATACAKSKLRYRKWFYGMVTWHVDKTILFGLE